MEKSKTKPEKKAPRSHSAQEKATAVLSIWTEKRKPAEVCRELSIQWSILSLWQNRALEGMLQALEPRVNLEKGPALSPRLQTMLEKRGKRRDTGKLLENRLTERLTKVQETRTTKKK